MDLPERLMPLSEPIRQYYLLGYDDERSTELSRQESHVES